MEYLKRENWPSAFKEFERASSLRPDLAEGHYNIAKGHYNLGRFLIASRQSKDKGRKHLQKALELGPSPALRPRVLDLLNFLEHTLLGIKYMEKINRSWPNALKEFQKAFSVEPHLAEANYNLGTVLLKLQIDRNKGLKHVRTALKLNPDPELRLDILQALISN